jgi:peptidoglycan/LPS O-acetylase OafA/YrhL
LKNHRYHELDALRAIAALGIVCWHYVNAFHASPFGHVLAPFFRRGLLMVDFFFILSGFVLPQAFWVPQRSALLARNVWSRVARLYPLHLATLAAVALLQWYLVNVLKSETFVYHNNSYYNFVLNVFLLQNSGLQNGASFNAPSWSISTEFLVNIVFLVLIFFSRRIATTGMAIIGAIAIYGLVSHGIVQGGNVFAVFDGGVVRTFAGFFLGVGLYELHRHIKPVGHHAAFDLIVLTTMVISGSYLASPSWWSNQGDALCSFVFFPILILSMVRCRIFSLLLSKPIPVYLGEISYSIYLIHFPLQLLAHTIEASLAINFPYGSRWMFIAFMLTLIGTASLSYRLIEVPGKRWLLSLLQKRISPDPRAST